MIDINVMPIFVSVVENGGFAAAGRALGISKSAVSKRITLLENRLGVQLLHRTTRKLSLTEAGERYFNHAREVLQSARDAEDSVLELQRAPRGTLRISTPMSFGRLHLAPLIAMFLKEYPTINVEMVMNDQYVDLVEMGFDIALRAGTLKDSSMVARRLAPLYSIVCASPDYLSRSGRPECPSTLTEHNCLHYSYSTGSDEWVFNSTDGRQISAKVTGSFRVNNSEALREVLILGLGIARLPTFIAGSDIVAGRLEQLFPEYRMPEQHLYAVFPERRHLPAKVRLFIDFIAKKIGNDRPYWDKGIIRGD